MQWMLSNYSLCALVNVDHQQGGRWGRGVHPKCCQPPFPTRAGLTYVFSHPWLFEKLSLERKHYVDDDTDLPIILVSLGKKSRKRCIIRSDLVTTIHPGNSVSILTHPQDFDKHFCVCLNPLLQPPSPHLGIHTESKLHVSSNDGQRHGSEG